METAQVAGTVFPKSGLSLPDLLAVRQARVFNNLEVLYGSINKANACAENGKEQCDT